MGGDDELDLRFDITEGSDIPRFRFTFRHKRTNLESSFVYFAWAKSGTTYEKKVVTEYFADSFPKPLSFLFSLREVTVRKISRYDPQIEAIEVWRMQSDNNAWIVSWLCDDTSIGMNLQISATEHNQSIISISFKLKTIDRYEH